jgi:transcriptional regulator with XRE-family HTH domain
MKVLGVFGYNLRLLTAQKGSIAHVARDLEIGRVQFQRYLRGESFPKPHVLARICSYFNVDARILTEALDGVSTILPETAPVAGLAPNMAAAFGYALQGQAFAVAADEVADGLYTYWTQDGADSDLVHRKVMQIKTLNGARVVRMIHGRWFYPAFVGPDLRRQRDMRGVLLGIPECFVILMFHAAPSNRVSFLQFVRNPLVANGAFFGFVALGRAEVAGVARTARVYIEPVLPGFRGILDCARMPLWLRWDEVPRVVRDYLRQPV